MKDSGMAWIGDIPEEWNIAKIKHHLRRSELRNPRNVRLLSLYREYGVIPKDSRSDNHNVASENTDNYKYVRPGDFVINKMKAWQGSVAVSEYEGIVSPAYYVYVFLYKTIHKRYFHYLLRSCYKDEFRRLSGGLRVGQWDLPSDAFENTLFLLPPCIEQVAIAKSLDKKCAEIDKVVEKTRESIEEYKKLKQAVITEAVTKGVRDPRPMKNSDDQWWPHLANSIVMSRVGLHYDIILGKMLSSSPSNESDDLLPYYCAANIHFNKIDRALNLKKMWFSQEEASKLSVQKGDLLVVEGGAGAGGSAVVASTDGIVCIQNSVMIVRSRNCNSAKYLMYVVESLVKRGYIDITCNKATIPHFTKDKLSNTRIPMWESSEQQEIADYLDAKCEEIDRLISKKEQLIAELEAYKKSLIYEYVTGKKEVPA